VYENGSGNPSAPVGEHAEVVWEKNLFKNTWAMFCGEQQAQHRPCKQTSDEARTQTTSHTKVLHI
jgi:hypothetical protein